MERIITRRHLLTTAAIVPLLAGCTLANTDSATAVGTITGSIPLFASDVIAIANDISAYVDTLPGGASAGLKAAVAKLSAVAGQIGATAAGPMSDALRALIASFGSGLGDVVNLSGGAGAISNLGTFGNILQFSLKLLPTILAVAGVLARPALAARAPVSQAEIDGARAYLYALRR